jgi:hypothetical protein
MLIDGELIRYIIALVRRFFCGEPVVTISTAQPRPWAPPEKLPAVEKPVVTVPAQAKSSPSPPPGKSAGRSVSPSLAKAIALLVSNPGLTSLELADGAGVSRGYARTLLNKAKASVKASVKERQPIPKVAKPSIVRENVREKRDHVKKDLGPDMRDAVDELRRSLQETQAELHDLAAAPVVPRTSVNLNKRAKVLHMQQKGRPVQEIAKEMGMNVGEVEFILKVDRLIAEHH